MVAQSLQRGMPVAPTAPQTQGFTGFSVDPRFTQSLMATVHRNNAELSNMTSGMGFTNMRPNLSLG